ncbi:MAG TPA: hypothetical protein V6D11_20390, partial [Waterburya sp.]
KKKAPGNGGGKAHNYLRKTQTYWTQSAVIYSVIRIVLQIKGCVTHLCKEVMRVDTPKSLNARWEKEYSR